MSKRKRLTQQELEEALMLFYKESDLDIRFLDQGTKALSTLKRERLYFILALTFGFIFNLAASAIDNTMQTLSNGTGPDPLYFSYSGVVIALSFVLVVWMLSKIRDLDQYIKLAQNAGKKRVKNSELKN